MKKPEDKSRKAPRPPKGRAQDTPPGEDDSLSKTFTLPLSGGWEWNVITGRMTWSDRFFEIIGHSPNSLPPSLAAFLRIVHPEDRARVKARMEEAPEKRGQLRVEFRVVASYGVEKSVRLRGEALQDSGGHPEKVVGLIQEVTSRMKADEAMRRHEQKLSFHMENTPLGVIEWDTDFNVVEWNPAAEKIFGFTKTQALGRNALDLIIPPQAREDVQAAWKDLLAKRGGARGFSENVTRDGRTIFCEWYNTPLLDMDGEALQVASLVQDVTDRETARKALKESEERYRLLVELSPVAIAVHADGVIVYVNPACLAMFGGRDVSELVGRPVLSLVAPEYHAAVKERIHAMLVDGVRAPAMEQRFIRADGAQVDVEVTASPFTYQGKPAILVAFQDITKSRMAERNLGKANDFLQNVIDTMPNPVFHKDTLGVYTGCNKAFERFMGKNRELIIGKTVFDLTPREMAETYHQMDQELFRERGAQAYETKVAQEGGGFRSVMVNKACFYEPDGALGGLVGMISDVTDLKKIQKELVEARDAAERASRAKSTFLSSIGHEVRTPLNSIIGFAGLLSADAANPPSESQRDFLQRIKNSGEHLLSLFDEILDLSRIESGRMTLPAKDVDLCEAALGALASVSEMASRHGVRLLGPEILGDLHIRGDLSRLTQILEQLLSNGIKFNKRGGEVSLSYHRESGGKVRITVADTGQGVPPEKLDKLFEPFDRLGAEGLNIKGAGVGLTLVKKLVEMMGGTVEVETKPGGGARFHILLPMIERGGEARERPPAAPGVRSCVLVVEDNPDNLELMKILLEKNTDYEILGAFQAPAAVEIARARLPLLILMDINLPGMDGYEALRLLQGFKETRDIPVIAVSSSVLPQEIRKGLDAGFARYITKPIVARLFIKDIMDAIKSSAKPANG
jgi:protein-histidine pros-kinase